ncbi:MAG TPA: hypothetical protein VFH10_14745 [Nocardioides sp.]|uniref:hypothetical protein n=1 Tax=Nocardioides sp. TaxID=35761 RepID=UPI002D7F6A0D|nr:hypothetical protein [Nocardioides sp.]HET6653897.1 hypothetical protein [Nocardioides sp.]
MTAPVRTPSTSALQRAVAFELGIWRSLWRWLLRRTDVPDGAEAFSYHRMATPVMWLWIFGSAVEIVAVDALLPWHTARILAGALGLWGLAWMIGMLGALSAHPHLVDELGVRVRNGFSVDLRVPWAAVASVTVQDHDLPSSMRSVQVERTEQGDVLAVGVSGRTNVLVRLREPTAFSTTRGEHVVTGLRLWADEQRSLVARVRDSVAATPR